MKTLKIAGIILAILAILYVGLVIYRIPAIGEEERSKAAVARIEAQKITLADVMGEDLPPVPNANTVDTTVEGIDANTNGIRDDVELAIFAQHPDSARLRASKLQYAKALQMYLTEVFNSETWRAVSDQDDRGYFCVAEVFQYLRPDRETATDAEWNTYFAIAESHHKNVKDLVFNTSLRREKYEEVFANYQVSSGSNRGGDCDLASGTFSN